VNLDLSGCKSSSISWACCLKSSDGQSETPGFCNLYNCGPATAQWDISKDKCDEVSTLSFLVPQSATTLTLQSHDGLFSGNVVCSSEHPCCGGSGSSCSSTGVCETVIELSTCNDGGSGNPKECYSDDDCDRLDDGCASGVCDVNGVCIQNIHPEGTNCRPSVDPCDVAEYCTGGSPQCPANLRKDDGYSFKCGTTQYLCAVDAADLKLNNGNSWVVGPAGSQCTLGTGELIIALDWPHCLTQCLERTCPNGKGISNYALMHCDKATGDWNCFEKHDVNLNYYAPVCPYV